MSQSDIINSQGSLNYLFNPRLNFLATQDDLASKCKVSLSQNSQFFSQKKLFELESCIGELRTDQNISDIYGVFYGLIHHCRFDQKSVQQTSTISREQIRKKRSIKDMQSQRVAKIKKTLLLMGQPEKDYSAWMEVLNHKNLFRHISKAKIYLKQIIEKNFQLIEKGTAKIKHSQLPNNLKIKLCILVMDIISLINTMRFMLNPFNQTDALVSKVIQEQTLLFNQASQKLNKDGQLNVVNSLSTTKIFYDALKFLMTQTPIQEKLLRFWYDLEQIRQRYLVQQNGMMRQKPIESYKKKIDAGIISNSSIPFQISQVHIEWLNIYNQYFLANQTTIQQNLLGVFQEYCHFFNYYIDQMIRKQEKQEIIQKYIGDYLNLIQKIWISINEEPTKKLYIREIFKMNEKFKLPLNIVENVSSIVLDTIELKIQRFTESKNQYFLKKLKLLVFELSQKLLQILPKEDLIEDYFVTLQKGVTALLKQRSAINKLFEKIYSYQTDIKLNEFFTVISNIQTLLQEKTFQQSLKNTYKQVNLSETIQSLYKTYENEKELIDEIKYFSKTVKALRKVEFDQDQLLDAMAFYSKKKSDILSNEKDINQQKLSELTYGLLDFIRILIFELIFKIKLKKKSRELDEYQKYLFKLLKFYHEEKEKCREEVEDIINQTQESTIKTQENEDQEENLDFQATELLLKKIKSQEINLSVINIAAYQEDDFASTAHSNKSHKFALNFFKKIYEIRLEIVCKNMKELQLKQKPLEEEYTYMKNVIYLSLIKGGNNDILQQEVNELAQIQYWFFKKRYYKAWRGVRKLKKIQEIKDLLQKVQTRGRNVLNIHVKIYIKYQKIYFNSQLINKRNDITQSQVTNLVDDVLKNEQSIINSSKLQESKQFVEELKAAVKILDRIEKVEILRCQIQQRDQQKRSLQQAKTYDLIEEKNQFSVLNGKLKIYRVQKHGTIMMRKYNIYCPNQHLISIQNKLEILKKLNLNNINIEIKDLGKIEIIVDEVQNQFDSYPKLVKYLIEAYYRIVKFCKKQMDFKLYPIMTKKDFQIITKNDQHYSLKINPYEGILLNLLLTFEDLLKSGIYIYPKHPFVALSQEIQMKFKDEKIYNIGVSNQVMTTQEYGFQHLLEQMKSISLENNSKDLNIIVEKILKCPYFWSFTDKSFELVEFKERYQSMVNVEQCRRKENERVRRSLDQQEQKTFTFEPLHPQYKKSYGYSKTTQMYFSIEGVMQKQAFLEDIGNFRNYGNYKEFRLQNYHWDLQHACQEKQKINQLIKMIAKKQRMKGSKNATHHRATFPSFHAHIRNLRNLLSHYIYDDVNKIEYTLEYKMNLIEKSFPKLFVFIYRWKPYLNKNFEEIQGWRVNLLLSLFKDEEKDKVIQRLLQIKEFKKYNEINNHRKNLQKMFNYSFDYRNDCKACNIICMLLKKKKSLWDVLADADDPNAKSKQGKQQDNPPYNYLFYQHKSFGCNGMQFLLLNFFNVVRRSSFTSEESAEIKSSINQLRLKVEKLNRKIENLQGRGYQEDDVISQNSSYESDEQKIKVKKNSKPIEIRFEELSQRQRNFLLQELLQFDYVNKNSIYQLELMFPYLFDDLRRERYQWDIKARKFD